MTFDQVHDLQQVYRLILHSMSRPGTISSLTDIAERVDMNLPCYDATILSAMTFFDAETTFHILSEDQQELIEKISEYTSAKYAPINEADFVIVLREDTETAIQTAINKCKNGTLIDPQLSSTWIIESTLLSNEGELTLRGPGIQHTAQLHTSFDHSMWHARNEKTKEYPLGIDLIFTDENAQVVCIPRTTSISVMGVS
ncbi:phosphonate C-P lyase system protein PhnH [Psychrobacillus psychrodurans]|uniref:Phosphonate C-P lyase system protein PhnH n=1 Tax=Psychrobacillus psychrodurans TaxID=126157 RepID=A0A9X3LB45_9BACI|nr:phosphonate C-P lyase system protein PhnH [Psychrobacillus psychrodurans]MCZ8534740.1 phosphonate C-P lyase system protein PhnH [Psychrobacillus psychrodurans]